MNELYFDPIQPSFEQRTKYYKEKLVIIDAHIHLLFYEFEIDASSTNYLPLAPDLCVDLVFTCSKNNPTAAFCGSVTQCRNIYFEHNMIYFGMRILPTQHFSNMKKLWSEFMDNHVQINELWEGKEEVISSIAQCANFAERVQIAVDIFPKKLFRVSEVSLIVSYCVKKIMEHNGKITVNHLADLSGYSARYIRQQFKKILGISPKQFTKIIRFQRALQLLVAHDEDILDIVETCGYYDHAHLLKELKQFNFDTLQLRELAN